MLKLSVLEPFLNELKLLASEFSVLSSGIVHNDCSIDDYISLEDFAEACCFMFVERCDKLVSIIESFDRYLKECEEERAETELLEAEQSF